MYSNTVCVMIAYANNTVHTCQKSAANAICPHAVYMWLKYAWLQCAITHSNGLTSTSVILTGVNQSTISLTCF